MLSSLNAGDLVRVIAPKDRGGRPGAFLKDEHIDEILYVYRISMLHDAIHHGQIVLESDKYPNGFWADDCEVELIFTV